MSLTVSLLPMEEAEINQAEQENTKDGSQDTSNDRNDVTCAGARTENRGSWKTSKCKVFNDFARDPKSTLSYARHTKSRFEGCVRPCCVNNMLLICTYNFLRSHQAFNQKAPYGPMYFSNLSACYWRTCVQDTDFSVCG